MKKLSVYLAVLMLPFICQAQKEGVVSFEEVMKFKIELSEDSGISQEQLEAMIPNEQIAQKWLFFDESASLFTSKDVEASEDAVEHTMNTSDGQVRIKMVRANGDNKVFHDIKKNTIVDQRNFLGKVFLVQDDAKKRDWKLTGATKDVAGYPCQQATAQDDDVAIEVWFTPAIPISTGPSGYMNLPGMVLEVNTISENGERHYIAREVAFKALEEGTLVAPVKGKKVSEAEFDQIVEEKTKEMSEQSGGRGVRIRMGGN